MFKVVQTSSTPNPNAIKFHLDQNIIEKGSKSYSNSLEAEKNDSA